MTLHQRQLHLAEQISNVRGENILIMLEEELSYHLSNGHASSLLAADLEELIKLADEPDDKDIVSEDEYKKATARWRMK